MFVLFCRPDWDATVSWLKGMGADVVTTEQDLKADLGEAVAAGKHSVYTVKLYWGADVQLPTCVWRMQQPAQSGPLLPMSSFQWMLDEHACCMSCSQGICLV